MHGEPNEPKVEMSLAAQVLDSFCQPPDVVVTGEFEDTGSIAIPLPQKAKHDEFFFRQTGQKSVAQQLVRTRRDTPGDRLGDSIRVGSDRDDIFDSEKTCRRIVQTDNGLWQFVRHIAFKNAAKKSFKGAVIAIGEAGYIGGNRHESSFLSVRWGAGSVTGNKVVCRILFDVC